MKAEAKLATREKVSTASAPTAETGVPLACRMTHASSAIRPYEVIAAISSTTSRRGLPRTRSSICRSTAAMNREMRPVAIDVPNRRSQRAKSDWT